MGEHSPQCGAGVTHDRERGRGRERDTRHLGIDIDVNKPFRRDKAAIPERGRLAQARAEHQHTPRLELLEVTHHRCVAGKTGDTNEERIVFRKNALAARRAHHRRAHATGERRDLGSGITRAIADPDGKGTITKRIDAGVDLRGRCCFCQRRRVDRRGRCDRGRGRPLHGGIKSEMGNETSAAIEAGREAALHRGQLRGIIHDGGEVKRPAGVVQRRRQRRARGVLDGKPAPR